MRVGFASIYSFRPHVEHLYYLAFLIRQWGGETFALTCDGAIPACYARTLKGKGKLVECPKCVVGGVRSYAFGKVDAIKPNSYFPPLSHEQLSALVWSSSATLMRTETEGQLHAPEVAALRERLIPGAQLTYSAARRWIEERQLDAVIGFNGRMDMTAALALAASDAGVRYISVERSTFGHGIQMRPEGNCLALDESDRMAVEFRGIPLTSTQAGIAAAQVARRFIKKNDLEWRVYNREAAPGSWPAKGEQRVLIVPSSKNEFQGHSDWKEGWGDNTKALDQMLEVLGLAPSDLVVRGHPNWSERIGSVSGQKSEQHYAEWAKRRGVHYISSGDACDTYDLLKAADLVVLNGGSTALEAAALGKPVLCLGPAKYQRAGFSKHVAGPEDWGRAAELTGFDGREARRYMLRYLYTQIGRFPQFVDFVRAHKPTEFRYYEGADPKRLISLIQNGRLAPDDADCGDSDALEAETLRRLEQMDWAVLARSVAWKPPGDPLLEIRRRKGLGWIDGFRSRLLRGDRA